jgi:hypothetical protein
MQSGGHRASVCTLIDGEVRGAGVATDTPIASDLGSSEGTLAALGVATAGRLSPEDSSSLPSSPSCTRLPCSVRPAECVSSIEGVDAAPACTAEQEAAAVATNTAAEEPQVTAETSFVGALPALRLPLSLPGGAAGGAGEREKTVLPILSPPQSPLPYHRGEFFGPLSTLKPHRGEPECVRTSSIRLAL